MSKSQRAVLIAVATAFFGVPANAMQSLRHSRPVSLLLIPRTSRECIIAAGIIGIGRCGRPATAICRGGGFTRFRDIIGMSIRSPMGTTMSRLIRVGSLAVQRGRRVRL